MFKERDRGAAFQVVEVEMVHFEQAQSRVPTLRPGSRAGRRDVGLKTKNPIEQSVSGPEAQQDWEALLHTWD